jgi:hypothetical protein
VCYSVSWLIEKHADLTYKSVYAGASVSPVCFQFCVVLDDLWNDIISYLLCFEDSVFCVLLCYVPHSLVC